MPQSGQLIAAWERDMERVACIFKEELAGWLAGGTAVSREPVVVISFCVCLTCREWLPLPK